MLSGWEGKLRMKSKILKKDYFWLGLIFWLVLFLRFGGISWSLPHHFHPDEWNMGRAITRLSWANKFNPEFFAYGQFPLYLAYLSAKIYNLLPWLKIGTIDIAEAVFFLRFWSAFTGIGTVYLVYLISKKIFSRYSPSPISHKLPLFTTLLAAFTPGLIQISHFGTTESLLSFLLLFVVYLSILIYETKKTRYFIFLGIILGISFGTKITALTFTTPFGLVLVLMLKTVFTKSENKQKGFLKLLGKFFLTLSLAFIFTIITSPYLVLAFNDSKNTLLYETAVATGKSPVFYTRQFINTLPIVFQLEKIFPYALGWPILILGSLGLLISTILIVKSAIKKQTGKFDLSLLVLTFTFLTYFFSQTFLFCKWTRFVAPIFPFLAIFGGITLSYLSNLRNLSYLLVFVSILPGIFFSQIYFKPDIRFQASEWIYQNIPSGAKVLLDTGNVLDIPILPPNSLTLSKNSNYGLSRTSFDFYHLDENPELLLDLTRELSEADWIFVPSRRIFANHMRFPKKYPQTAQYYQLLFSGQLGFSEVAIFYPYSKFKIFNSKFQYSDESAEETWSVFDHPVIRIYKKTFYIPKEQYHQLFVNRLNINKNTGR